MTQLMPRMQLTLSQYLALLIALGTVWVATVDLALGLAYAFAGSAVLVPLYLLRVQRHAFHLMFFGAAFIWLTHLLRPLVLVWDPTRFDYPLLGQVSTGAMGLGLIRTGIFSVVLLGGLWIGLTMLRHGRRTRDAVGVARQPFLIRARIPVLSALALFIGARSYLQLRVGLFTKLADPNVDLGFLSRLVPELLIYATCIVYLVRYRDQIKARLVVLLLAFLIGMMVLAMLGGSRAFIAQTLLVSLICLVAVRGDYRVALGRALVLATVSSWLLVVSFAFAAPLRRVVGQTGYTPELLPVLRGAAAEAFRPHIETMTFFADALTRRLIGFDGVLASDVDRQSDLREAFALGPTTWRILVMLVPRYDPEGTLTSGKAIGMYYSGHDLSVPHSGAVGLFGAARLVGSGPPGYVFVGIVGLLFGLFFRWTEGFRSEDLRLLVHIVGAYSFFNVIMSGNLDWEVSRFISSLAHLAVYGLIVWCAAQVLSLCGSSRGAGVRRGNESALEYQQRV